MISKPVDLLSNRQEMTRHSVSGFPLAGYATVFSKGTYDFVDWHWHTEFQLCIVTDGAVCFRVDDKLFLLKSGDGLFINSQCVHMARPHQSEEAAYFCVDFHPNMICSDKSSGLYRTHVLPALGNTGLTAVYLSGDDDARRTVLRALAQARLIFTERKPGFELDAVITVLEAWKSMVLLLPECASAETCGGNGRLKHLFLFIQEFYAEPLTLDRIADYVHLSRSECCRYFQKATGQTLFDYISQYRIEKSAELLRDTDISISRIAAEVGFGSQSYYAECFRRLKNVTPREYRLQRKIGRGTP